jgi:antitoxin YefM
METLSFSETRANLKAVMDRVVADSTPIKVTRARGQEAVVLVSARDWASIEETNYLLRSPRNAERLLDSIRRLEAGEGEEHELLDPKA